MLQDACPVELACLLSPLANLKDRISELLAEWPDQPSLLQLMRGVQALLSLPITVPLMKVNNRLLEFLTCPIIGQTPN